MPQPRRERLGPPVIQPPFSAQRNISILSSQNFSYITDVNKVVDRFVNPEGFEEMQELEIKILERKLENAKIRTRILLENEEKKREMLRKRTRELRRMLGRDS